MMEQLLPGERIDELHQKGYRIIQKSDGFCFGMDAVLLSAYARIGKQDKVLDMGCGTGILPILMEARTEGGYFTGLEIQEEFASMAGRSVALNGQEDRISIVCGDIKEASSLFGRESFDVVVSNPPYMVSEHGYQNPDQKKAIARHEILCNLEDLLRETKRVLKNKGRFYLVHRTYRMAEIIHLLVEYGLEPKRIRFVYPYREKEPNIMLIESIKGAKSRVQVEPPLIVYEEPGVYTDEIYEIYGYEKKKKKGE
ncbi:MAG: tRNA1(Val) (adenine(37)-N6)-methyltransferase [Lachnospiraceae bacterium]|nr:tRNA1(Val) (adenine(37)-N6)-methyltransferase [Lachnospiraceae bacterium]